MFLTLGLPVSLGHSRRDDLLDGAPPSVYLLGFLKCGFYQLEANGDQVIVKHFWFRWHVWTSAWGPL